MTENCARPLATAHCRRLRDHAGECSQDFDGRAYTQTSVPRPGPDEVLVLRSRRFADPEGARQAMTVLRDAFRGDTAVILIPDDPDDPDGIDVYVARRDALVIREGA